MLRRTDRSERDRERDDGEDEREANVRLWVERKS